MKKSATFLILIMLVSSSVFLVSSKETENQVQTQSVSFSFSDISFSFDQDFVIINSDDAQTFTTQPGKPCLPVIEKTLYFPEHTRINSVTYTTKDTQSMRIDSPVALTPIPAPVSKMNNDNRKTTSFYDHPHPFPEQGLQYDCGKGLYQGKPAIILKMQLHPVTYYPNQDRIEYTEHMQVQITYHQREFEQKNSESLDEDYKMIILTPEQFTSNLQPLVSHKQSRDIPTKLVSLNEIYQGTYFPVQGSDDAEKIKYFIKNAYDYWETQYVLLIGGEAYFPVRKCHVYIGYHDDSEIIVSDLYYADLYDENNTFQTWDTNQNNQYAEYNWTEQFDELDLFPDVYIGRLACTNENQVDNVVNKIINYEQAEAFKKSWFKNLVLIGGDSFTPIHGDESGVNEGELANQHVLDAMTGFIGTKLWVSNAKLAGLNPTGVERIQDAIGSGCGFVHFSGHGSTGVWTTYPHNGTKQNMPTPLGSYRIDHIRLLQNGYQLPVVVTGACSVGKFQANENCFSWSFLANPTGGGIASFGATGLGYACLGVNVTDYVVEKMALEMFKAYREHEAKTVGEMWATAITNYITPVLYDSDYKTIEEWQPFCDPSVALREEYLTPSQPPLAPTIIGPRSGKADYSYVYNATTTDPDRNEIYYLFDWGDDSFSDWIGPVRSGESVSMRHTFSEERNYSIRVKAKDEHGYESNWSAPLVVAMPKAKEDQSLFMQWIMQRFLPFVSDWSLWEFIRF